MTDDKPKRRTQMALALSFLLVFLLGASLVWFGVPADDAADLAEAATPLLDEVADDIAEEVEAPVEPAPIVEVAGDTDGE